MSGDVGESDRDGLGAHAAHDPVVAIGGNQQNAHRKSPCSGSVVSIIVPIVHQAVRIDYALPGASPDPLDSSFAITNNVSSSSRTMPADAHSRRV